MLPTVETPQTSARDPADVLCFRCEYDLRGLERGGLCPECGSAIETSWRREEARRERGSVPLALASRRWLGCMMIGCFVLLASAAIIEIQAACVAGEFRIQMWIARELLQLGILAAGLWLVSAREPATATFVNGPLVRWTLRCALLLDLIILTVGYRMAGRNMINFERECAKGQGLVYALATLFLLLRLADAAQRDDRRGLRRWIVVTAWIMPAALAAQSIFQIEIYMRRNASWILSPHPVLGFPEVIAVLPFGLARDVPFASSSFFWTIQALLSLGMMALIAASAWMFRRALATSDTILSDAAGDRNTSV